MTANDLQAKCEIGSRQLIEMKYLDAEKTLAEAEHIAWAQHDFDALARLYMPLQEARRQRRQRCGEGMVCLDLTARSADESFSARKIVDQFPQGQLLVAGWGSIEPAKQIRALQAERGLYVETFLAAVYPVESAHVIAIVPTDAVALPQPSPMPIDVLLGRLPAHSVVLPVNTLPHGATRGTDGTYGRVMDLWERLARPFLAAADATQDPLQRIEGYRRTISVDYACELAHQKLSDVAKSLARKMAK